MFHRSTHVLGRCVAILAAFAAVGCSAQVGADPVAVDAEELWKQGLPEVPAALEVPECNKLAFRLAAEGVQIYACTATAAGGYAWTFKAPDANLYGKHGLAGAHYVGPTWEGLDGSKVVGSKVAGVSVDATAVPWLLLSAASHAGEGSMSSVTFIQRLSTTGGLAPTTACNADNLGTTSDSPYTADYYFYEATGGCDRN